jgi:hypothetical protein
MRKAWMVLIAGFLAASTAEATIIDWADELVSSTFVFNPQNALGAPDNATAGIGANPGSATYAYTGGATTHDTASLAALLGTTTATLSSANFIAFEVNGSAGLGFEGSLWSFDDGSSVFNYQWIEGSSANGPVVAAGTMSFAAYAAFFGIPPLTITGDIAFLLFDVPVNVDSASFEVTLTSSRLGRDAGTPDPDAMGRLVNPVPEPSSLGLVALAAAGAAAFRRARG